MRGFYWFFNEVSTFMPFNETISAFRNIYDMIMNLAHISSDLSGWEIALQILKIIGTVLILPFNIIVPILKDLFNIIAFVFRFLGVNLSYAD